MKNKQIIILIGLIIFGILGYFFLIKGDNQSPVVASLPTPTIIVTPTITPTPTPIVFNFNSSTDLNSELQTVDPKVESTDFDKLKSIISSL